MRPSSFFLRSLSPSRTILEYVSSESFAISLFTRSICSGSNRMPFVEGENLARRFGCYLLLFLSFSCIEQLCAKRRIMSRKKKLHFVGKSCCTYMSTATIQGAAQAMPPRQGDFSGPTSTQGLRH